MQIALIYDGRNLYEVETMEAVWVEYYSLGRRAVNDQVKVVPAVNYG